MMVIGGPLKANKSTKTYFARSEKFTWFELGKGKEDRGSTPAGGNIQAEDG